MKHIDGNFWYRIFGYAGILVVMLLLGIHEKSNFWLLLGFTLSMFSTIEESTSEVKRSFSFIAILKKPLFGSFLSNVFRFSSLFCFVISLIMLIFKWTS
ncbi:MAG: hypothetical protein RI956_746 [Pseudomonadota bacterium]|jgi:uncharacterized membrane protein